MLTAEDKAILDFAKRQIENLQVEIKTVDGFITQYLSTKYKCQTPEELQALINGVTPESTKPELVPDNDTKA